MPRAQENEPPSLHKLYLNFAIPQHIYILFFIVCYNFFFIISSKRWTEKKTKIFFILDKLTSLYFCYIKVSVWINEDCKIYNAAKTSQ